MLVKLHETIKDAEMFLKWVAMKCQLKNFSFYKVQNVPIFLVVPSLNEIECLLV